MDPDAALAEIRSVIAPGGDFDADRLAELVAGLDEWLSGGGFLPADWAR